ncbi:MAG: flavin reductase [Chloroflexi bacterium]|nr:flavin reductase [Chloroflexota bacterium]MYD49085.1 flavin reductase [Chloroflexota bacterium]
MPNPAPDIIPPDAGPLLAGLSAPLAAVSTRSGEVVNAQIAVAITAASIVLHRPRLIVQIYHTNYTHDLIATGGVLAVNFLNHDQLPLIWQLGMRSGRDGDKLNEIAYSVGTTGSPLLEGSYGYLDCRVVNAMDGGDMTAFLVEVLAAQTNGGQRLTWREARPRLPRHWADEWDRKIAGEMNVSLATMADIDPAAWAYPPAAWDGQ